MEQETPPKKSRWLWKLIFFLFILPVGLFSFYTWATLNYVYATGERAGYLQKFSRKGWVFKTWEGEIAMVNLPGTAPEKFQFTVRSDGVAKKITALLGQRISIMYNQHVGIPVSWFGDTPYFVTDVRAVPELTTAIPATPK